MKVQIQGETARVSAVEELGIANCKRFRDAVRGVIEELPENGTVEIDLSETAFLDSSGLGTLIALKRIAQERQGRVRLINPAPQAKRLIELTRIHQIFDIVNMEPRWESSLHAV